MVSRPWVVFVTKLWQYLLMGISIAKLRSEKLQQVFVVYWNSIRAHCWRNIGHRVFNWSTPPKPYFSADASSPRTPISQWPLKTSSSTPLLHLLLSKSSNHQPLFFPQYPSAMSRSSPLIYSLLPWISLSSGIWLPHTSYHVQEPEKDLHQSVMEELLVLLRVPTTDSGFNVISLLWQGAEVDSYSTTKSLYFTYYENPFCSRLMEIYILLWI